MTTETKTRPETTLPEGAALKTRQTVTVTGNPHKNPSFDHLVHFDTFEVTVETYTPKAFRAVVDGKEYVSTKSLQALMQEVVDAFNGSEHSLSSHKKTAHYALEIGEKETVSNEPEHPEQDLLKEHETALARYAKTVNDAVEKVGASHREKVQATFDAGEALAQAKAALGGDNKVSKQAWGIWVAKNLPASIRANNKLNEHIAVAAIPATLIAQVPEGVSSAKSIVAWRDKLRNMLATSVADHYEAEMSQMSDADYSAALDKFKTCDPVALAKDASDTKEIDASIIAVFNKVQENAEKHVEAGPVMKAQGKALKGKALQVIDDKGESARLTAIAAGDMVSFIMSNSDAAKALFFRRAVLKALHSLLNAPSAADEASKAAEKAAEKYSDSGSNVGRAFADMTQEEAAAHLAKIAASRSEDAVQILDMAANLVEQWAAKKDQEQEEEEQETA